jgi:hypothetical protein
MNPDYKLCDRCGKATKLKPIFFCTGREMDPAGSTEDVGKSADLCGVCASLVLSQILEGMSFEESIAWLKFATRKPS